MIEPVKEYTSPIVNNMKGKESYENLYVSSKWLDQLEWFMMIADKDSVGVSWSEAHDNYVHLSNYDGAWLLSSETIKDKCDVKILPGIGMGGNRSMQVDPSFFENVNCKVASFQGVDTENVNFLERVRSVDAKKWRHLRKYYSHILEYTFSHYYEEEEKWVTTKTHLAVYPKVKHSLIPVCIDPKYVLGGSFDERFDNHKIEIQRTWNLLQIHLTEYYEWFVSFKDNTSKLSIKIPIDPYLTKEVFKLREVPEGKNRRAALRNFVKEHLRCYNGEKYNVIEHLRGSMKFEWNGFEVKIIPSKYDLQRIEKTKKNKRKK